MHSDSYITLSATVNFDCLAGLCIPEAEYALNEHWALRRPTRSQRAFVHGHEDTHSPRWCSDKRYLVQASVLVSVPVQHMHLCGAMSAKSASMGHNRHWI
jgi:hypothetical protein